MNFVGGGTVYHAGAIRLDNPEHLAGHGGQREGGSWPSGPGVSALAEHCGSCRRFHDPDANAGWKFQYQCFTDRRLRLGAGAE